MRNLQDKLNALSLKPSETERFTTEKLLIGKIMNTRIFRRYTITEIISKTWRLKHKVNIEKLWENIFKFDFGSREDRNAIFRARPWSINGALFVLKEWPEELTLQQISFLTTTFVLQIHGLPPVFLHEGTAKMVGNTIGKVHEETINRRSIVAQRYLRFRVDISTAEPLPAGFFQEREEGDDFLIQFKYERLSDFCFNCGRLDHITGRCLFGEPATVTTAHGASAKLYGPWLRAENEGNLLFLNPPEKGEAVWRTFTSNQKEMVPMSDTHYLCDRLSRELDQGVEAKMKQKEFQNSLNMCQELAALKLTLERQDLEEVIDLQGLVLEKLRNPEISMRDLGFWAKNFLQHIIMFKTVEKRGLDGFDSEELKNRGFGPQIVSKARGDAYRKEFEVGLDIRKRPAQLNIQR